MVAHLTQLFRGFFFFLSFFFFFFTMLALCYFVRGTDFCFVLLGTGIQVYECCLNYWLHFAAFCSFYFSHTRSLPSWLCQLLSIYNGLCQRAAVELDFCLCLQQHSTDPLIEGLKEERPEAAEGLQSCGLKQPASDKQRGPPGERSLEEKHRKTLRQKKMKHEIRPECSSISCERP